LVLLGAWGGLIPLVGPLFNYAYTPDRAWVFNDGRIWLSIVPGAATVLGGLIVLLSANRAIAIFGAWLAALAGVWFVVGGPVSTLWTNDGANAAGEPVGGTFVRAFEQLGFFTGLGAVIVFFAALALGRFTVLGVKEAASAEREAYVDSDEAPTDPLEQPPLTTAPGSTTPPAMPSTYAGTAADENLSDRTARRLDDHPDERLRRETPSRGGRH
jgi:hypothetical protein